MRMCVCVCGKVEAEVWLRPEIVVVFQLWIWLQFLFALLFTWLISCHLLLSVRERVMRARGERGQRAACIACHAHNTFAISHVREVILNVFWATFFSFCISTCPATPTNRSSPFAFAFRVRPLTLTMRSQSTKNECSWKWLRPRWLTKKYPVAEIKIFWKFNNSTSDYNTLWVRRQEVLYFNQIKLKYI